MQAPTGSIWLSPTTDWAEAKRRCRLDEAALQTARELGLNPKSLIKNIPSKSEPWKAPVKDWIRRLYDRRRQSPVAANRRENRADTCRELEPHDLRRFDDDKRFALARYEQFRTAANYVAAAFASVAAVKRVAFFGSVLASPGRAWRNTRGTSAIHEPKDVDLAVWIDDATELNQLRVARSRAVNQLFEEAGIGVAHHQVDVFLLDATTGRYLGRLCCFNQCPKGKRECQVSDCGKVPFMQQHDGFVFQADTLRPSRISVLYDRGQPGREAGIDDIPF